jgi:hypothetical protein
MVPINQDFVRKQASTNFTEIQQITGFKPQQLTAEPDSMREDKLVSWDQSNAM